MINRSIFLFLLGIVQVYAANTYSQQTRFSMNFEKTRLETVLNEIEIQSDYYFLYNQDYVDVDQMVDIRVNDLNIDQLLSRLLAPTGIAFSIHNRQIVLIKEENRNQMFVDKSVVSVKGRVTDSSGQPLPGVSIIIKNSTQGTVTNTNGDFYLQNVPQGATLVFSFVGMRAREEKVDNRQVIDVIMEEEMIGLDEVVAVGYGTQKKGNLATAITSIKSEILQNRPVQTVSETIQGEVPGLSITSTSRPGMSPVMQLRGATSLNGGGSPLVLVDGVPGEFDFLNVGDIESINVLKDAASSAIYGSRAANGVILITTKRGKTGKPTFRYNGSIGINTPTAMPEFCSSAVYAHVVNEAEMNVGRAAPWTTEEMILFENGTDPNRYPNTNWLGLATQNSLTTRHAIEASGGSEFVKYLVSAGVDHQTGVFPENMQNVFNVRSNTDIVVSKKFNISFDLRYNLRKLDELNNVNDAYNRILAANPTMVAYYTDGTYGYNAGFFINPLVDLFEGGHTFTERHDASGIFKFEYEITDGLKFTGLANANYILTNSSQHIKKLFYKDFFTKEEYEFGDNSLNEDRDYKGYYNLQALLTFKKTFGKHTIDALAGYQQENEESNGVSAARTGYPTDLVWVLDAGPKDNWSNEGNAAHWAISSMIGRLNYDFAGKYILSASIRSDASSRFAKGNRWSAFPSFAAAWRISQESFVKNSGHAIDDLKIRVSWGETGASAGLGLYPSYTTISMDGIVLNSTWMQTAKLNTIGNEDLGWERTEMFDVGVDLRTVNGRLGVSGDYYVKRTKDILIGLPVPLEYGFGEPNVNIGKMGNHGWEIEVKWNDQRKGFKYEVSANLSNNTNEVLDLGGTGPWKTTGYTDIGLPFQSLYGYEASGLFQSNDEVENAPFQNSNTKAGDIRYRDQNDDSKIDADDRVVIGDPYPHYLFGIRLGAKYKILDINVLFQGVGKKDLIINDRAVRPLNDTPIFKHQLDYWNIDNTDATYPRILNKTDGDHNYVVSDFWKFNAGYLRMKSLQIGYTLPERIIKPSGFSSVRIYFSANNLFTISDFVPGWDPEVTNSLTYPFSRTYSFGLNVQF